MKVKFDDVVDVARFANCASCNTYVYTLPCSLDVDFEDFIFVVGKLKYPLSKVKIIRIDNEDIKLTSRVGRNWFEVKFKKGLESEVGPVKDLIKIQVAAYVEYKNNITVEI